MHLFKEDKFFFLNYSRNPNNSLKKDELMLITNFNDLYFSNILNFLFENFKYPYYFKRYDFNSLLKKNLNKNIKQNLYPIIFYDINIIFKRYGLDNLLSISESILYEIQLLIKKFSPHKIIFISFSNLFDYQHYSLNEYVKNLNLDIKKKYAENLIYLDSEYIIKKIGQKNSYDYKLFYKYEIMYSYAFCNELAYKAFQLITSLNGLEKKVLVLDCDNTLWPGIVGELEKNFQEKNNFRSFMHIQNLIKNIQNQGILLILNSKNNYKDVKNFFELNKDIFILKFDDFILKKINWNKKTENMLEISKELKLSIDSFIFLDDSKFEIELMNKTYPEITSILVPESINEYISVINNLHYLFRDATLSSEEDKKRFQDYINNKNRNEIKSIMSYDDYISSLSIVLSININNINNINRYSQMTQKTNQFNLTTKRYTESDIINFIDDDKVDVFSIDVSDKFGSSGITGLAIIKLDKNTAFFDTFLLSCRIIGRNIEEKFIYFIINYLYKHRQIKYIYANFIKTQKNILVSKFYDQNFFELVEESKNYKNYKLKSFDVVCDKNPNIKYKYE